MSHHTEQMVSHACGALLTIIAIYEAYALATGRVPAITDIVRNKISEKPHEAVAWFTFFGMLAGWLLGHLGR